MYERKILDTETEGLSEPPIAVIRQEDLDLIFGFVLNHSCEIKGRGYIRQVGNILNIEDVFILPQKTSLGYVDENEGAIHKYIVQNLDKDLDLMNFQWHSHPGDVYYSSTDQKNIREWGKTMNLVVNLVVNKEFEYVCRLDIFEPIEPSMEIPVIVTHEISDEIMQFCQDEIAKKVTMTQIEKVHKMVTGKQELPVGNTVVIPLDNIFMQG